MEHKSSDKEKGLTIRAKEGEIYSSDKGYAVIGVWDFVKVIKIKNHSIDVKLYSCNTKKWSNIKNWDGVFWGYHEKYLRRVSKTKALLLELK